MKFVDVQRIANALPFPHCSRKQWNQLVNIDITNNNTNTLGHIEA